MQPILPFLWTLCGPHHASHLSEETYKPSSYNWGSGCSGLLPLYSIGQATLMDRERQMSLTLIPTTHSWQVGQTLTIFCYILAWLFYLLLWEAVCLPPFSATRRREEGPKLHLPSWEGTQINTCQVPAKTYSWKMATIHTTGGCAGLSPLRLILCWQQAPAPLRAGD